MSNLFMVNQANKLGETAREIGKSPQGAMTIPIIQNETMEIHDARLVFSYQDVTGDTAVWGNSLFTYGTNYFGESFNNDPFVKYVVNGHNLFPEEFNNERFIDASTTATISVENKNALLDTDEKIVTPYIAKEDKVYKRIKITINTDDSDGTTGTDYLTATAHINGVDYPLTIGDWVDIDNASTDGIKLTIENTGYIVHDPSLNVYFGDEGLAFPLALYGPTRITKEGLQINEFYVQYEE